MIPARLIRTVPEHASDEVERWWAKACDLHPTWDHVTHRDPLDPAWFPLTSGSWGLCQNGAQLAGLIRLESLWFGGGFYLDSDLELFRPLDALRECAAVGTWEDEATVPDWFLAAEPYHPAIGACLNLALDRLHNQSNGNWRDGCGAWATGPGATTTVLPGRSDVLLLPPQALAPYHYTELAREGEPHHERPFCLGAHRWRGSWLLPEEAPCPSPAS